MFIKWLCGYSLKEKKSFRDLWCDVNKSRSNIFKISDKIQAYAYSYEGTTDEGNAVKTMPQVCSFKWKEQDLKINDLRIHLNKSEQKKLKEQHPPPEKKKKK